MFIDEVRILVKAGDGGNGCLAFRREKYVPRGGPSGGDGGRGGDVYLVATQHQNTLLHFRFNPEHKAERGRHGEGSNRTGHEGTSIDVLTPVGTVIYDAETGEKLHDFTTPGERFLVARGGRGGRGNARFATSTHQAPTEHEPGRQGQERRLRLELKLLADVGVIGFPNAGKSTLVSRLSAAHPRIADYPFTTLEPTLGIVRVDDDRSFVIADLPGLMPGAAEGRGLGHQFLRHTERTRLLLHMLDMDPQAGRDPIDDLHEIDRELAAFSADLAAPHQLIVGNKADLPDAAPNRERFEQFCASNGLTLMVISAVTGTGLADLVRAVASHLESISPTLAADGGESSGSIASSAGGPAPGRPSAPPAARKSSSPLASDGGAPAPRRPGARQP